MAEPLLPALSRLRAEILDDEHLVRALATGRRRGREEPRYRRVELRYVDLKGGRHLQVTAYDGTQALTSNHRDPREVLDDLLDLPFGNWHVDTDVRSHQLRVTKKGEALLHTTERAEATAPQRSHDQAKERLLAEDHPVLRALGIADEQGRVKPSRQAKYRQVEEFLRALDAALDDATRAGRLRVPTTEDPLRVVDLGCGNAYLTFAAHAWLSERLPVALTGVDVKEQSRRHNSEVAAGLGVDGSVRFVQAGIADVQLEQAPDVVLALHACDTATDDALFRAVEWEADLVLAAPCCHHDLSAQLRREPTPPGYDALTRDGILRERLADTLTDAVRASLLRIEGYRVDVVEFVDSAHTPRNTLLRAVRTSGPGRDRSGDREDYDRLVGTWRLRPALAELLAGRGA
ncbi:Methyltransferase domain-containing protein [Nocardioides scoriae]|uniref:Methyltransferase domain-containing protein n=1 Tax=Nocardioides scoriae TaxID=642780 RepID=A0A1H1SAM5_9ACTN|nr:SAM-dependent methyltransferase [Nocardioides scoriae]SDS45037.1 Methyltransferase domain-containing protein [Nocardioides scoriae]